MDDNSWIYLTIDALRDLILARMSVLGMNFFLEIKPDSLDLNNGYLFRCGHSRSDRRTKTVSFYLDLYGDASVLVYVNHQRPPKVFRRRDYNGIVEYCVEQLREKVFE